MRGRFRCFVHCGSRGGTRRLTWRAMGRNAVKGTSLAVVSDCYSVPCRRGQACKGESGTMLVKFEDPDTTRTRRNQAQQIPARVQSPLLMDAGELGAFDRIFTGSRHENSRVDSLAVEAT